MINKNDLRKAISSIAISNAKRNTIYKAFSDLDSITKEEFDSVKSDISKVVESMLTKDTIGKANGVASLDSNGSVPIEQLGNIDTTLFLIVRELPTTDIKTDKIYLVPKQVNQGNNIYVEYLYVDNIWEKLGGFKTEVDLSDFVNKDEFQAVATEVAKKVEQNTADIAELKEGVKDYYVGENDEVTGDPHFKNCKGNKEFLGEWHPFLIDHTDNTGDATHPVGQLMDNNHFRFVSGAFAPTVGITEAMRAACDV